MADGITLDFTKSQPLPGAADNAAVSLDFSKAETIAPRSKSLTESMKDFGSEFWKQIDPVQMFQGMAHLLTNAQEVKDEDAASRLAVAQEGHAAFQRGDNAEGVAHILYSAIPFIGPQLNEAGHQIVQGEYAKGLGKSTGMGVAMALPSAAGELVAAGSEFSPRSVNPAGQVEGALRPANMMEGSINRSVGATKGLTMFGNPARALVDEGIASPTNTGRLVATHAKLAELTPQLQSALQASKATVDLNATLKPIVDQALTKISKSVETPAAQMAALRQLMPLETQANNLGTVSMQVANDFKGRIGDAVNWEKRPSPMPDAVETAYRKAYGAVKEAVNNGTPGVADLNERVSNLMALKNSLTEQAQPAAKIGQGPMAGFAWAQRLEAYLGHAATPAIVGAQTLGPPLTQGASMASILAAKANKEKP